MAKPTEQTFTAVVHKEGEWYVATNLELNVTSQGHTQDEALARLKEATGLYLEDVSEEEPATIPSYNDTIMVKLV